MQRVESMARRLPQLYRDGELLRGGGTAGGVLGVPAIQLEVADEVTREIQRTHWFDATYELEHAARLAALLDIEPEPWQRLDTFQPWVHSLRDAMLRGGVTAAAIRLFVTEYAKAFQRALGVDVLAQMDTWNGEGAPGALRNAGPALIENPKVRREARYPAAGPLEPLQQLAVVNGGRGSVPASFLMTGSSREPEAVPLIANLTTGDALVYLDSVPEGKRLWIRVESGVTARLEGEDVTAKLRSISGLAPGTPVTKGQLVSPAKPLTLARGTNRLWFFPIALYDAPGLDRYLFSMPDLALGQGRFDSSRFDHALFYQQPAIVLYLTWVEETPASFEVRLPAAALGSPRPASEAIPERDRLASSLAEGVDRLRAAGVAAAMTLEAFAEEQRQLDRLRLVMPVRLTEAGPVGADRLGDSAGTFEVTSFDDSTFC